MHNRAHLWGDSMNTLVKLEAGSLEYIGTLIVLYSINA
jgi:hypothetical protein